MLTSIYQVLTRLQSSNDCHLGWVSLQTEVVSRKQVKLQRCDHSSVNCTSYLGYGSGLVSQPGKNHVWKALAHISHILCANHGLIAWANRIMFECLLHRCIAASKAEAISKGIQALARYIFDSLAYTMPVTQVPMLPRMVGLCYVLSNRVFAPVGSIFDFQLGMIFCNGCWHFGSYPQLCKPPCVLLFQILFRWHTTPAFLVERIQTDHLGFTLRKLCPVAAKCITLERLWKLFQGFRSQSKGDVMLWRSLRDWRNLNLMLAQWKCETAWNSQDSCNHNSKWYQVVTWCQTR